MRISQTAKTVISDDNISSPKEVRYSSERDVADTTTLVKSLTLEMQLPIGTTTLPLGSISQVKFIELTPSVGCTLELDAELVYLLGGKTLSLWTKTYTSVKITTLAVVDVSVVIGG